MKSFLEAAHSLSRAFSIAGCRKPVTIDISFATEDELRDVIYALMNDKTVKDHLVGELMTNGYQFEDFRACGIRFRLKGPE